ncbi:hypothetical protein KCP75_12630 [Salmonella enterica subsp. enterica]|nr:hypothetical protein KCP75_12630 [Salmonella enterica subsp. enterica]
MMSVPDGDQRSIRAYVCGVVCAGWRLTSYPPTRVVNTRAGWRLTSYPPTCAVRVCRL